MVSESDHEKFGALLSNDDGIRKPFENETLCAACAGGAGDGCERNSLLLDKVKSRVDGLLKLYAESGAFVFVPTSSFGCLVGGGVEDPD